MRGKAKRAVLPFRFPSFPTLVAAITAAGIVIAAESSGATAQAGADAAELLEYVEAYQKAWNTHDATAVAAFFSADADLAMGNLPAVRERGGIEGWWRAYFERQEPGRRGTFDMISARLLTPEVALVNVATTTGGNGDEGEPLPERKARGTWLLHWHGTEWRIAAMRGLPTPEDRVELMPSLEAAETLRPQIRAFVAAYEDAFNRHDPDALSAFYRDDADIIVRERPLVHGAEAIREWWRAYFSQPRPYHAVMIIKEIRAMAEDVALLNVIGTGAALEAMDRPVPVRQARATWILLREDGAWRIAALRVLPSEADRVIRHIGR